MSKNPNDDLRNFDMSFDEVKNYGKKIPVPKASEIIPRNNNYKFDLGPIKPINYSDYPDERYYNLVHEMYDLISSKAFKSIQSTLKSGIPINGQYQVMSQDMTKLYCVNIPNFYSVFTRIESQYTDGRTDRYLYDSSKLNEIVSGFIPQDEDYQKFVQINIHKGSFRRNENVYPSELIYDSGKIVMFNDGNIYASSLISKFLTTMPIEYVKVLFRDCINMANSSDNINGYPVTILNASVETGNDFWTKAEKIEDINVRKKDKRDLWKDSFR